MPECETSGLCRRRSRAFLLFFLPSSNFSQLLFVVRLLLIALHGSPRLGASGRSARSGKSGIPACIVVVKDKELIESYLEEACCCARWKLDVGSRARGLAILWRGRIKYLEKIGLEKLQKQVQGFFSE